MRKIRSGLLLVLLLVLTAACASRPPVRYWTEQEVIDFNRHRLLKLEKGMEQAKALLLMERKTFTGTKASVNLSPRPEMMPHGGVTPLGYDEVESYERQTLPLKNPLKKLSHRAKDGHWLEVYFFFTASLGTPDRVTDREVTPIVFKDGVLVGWGWPFYTDKTGIRPRR